MRGIFSSKRSRQKLYGWISVTSSKIRTIFLHPPISKRHIFVFETVLLTAALILTQLVSFDLRYPFVIGLAILSYALSAYALREDLDGIEYFTLLSPIALFSAGVALFYFLLPVRWLTRIPVAGLYAIGVYALLLTNNIFNVAAIRTIALLRAARSVGFLISVVTFYLIESTLVSQRNIALYNSFITFFIGFLVSFPVLWGIELTRGVSSRVFRLTFILSIILAQVSWILSFLPTPPPMVALTLSTIFYSTVGMAVEYLDEKLYKKTVAEFLFVNVIVVIMLILTTRWR